MKTTGVIKLLTLALNTILISSLPWPKEPPGLLTSPIIPFLSMSIIVPCYYLLVKREKKEHLKWPDWNASLFNRKNGTRLNNVDFSGAMFATIGLAMIGSTKIRYDEISQVGLTSVSFGFGILFGLLMTVIIGKQVERPGMDV